jgi:hypothetical protein
MKCRFFNKGIYQAKFCPISKRCGDFPCSVVDASAEIKVKPFDPKSVRLPDEMADALIKASEELRVNGSDEKIKLLRDNIIWAVTHYGIVKTDGIFKHLKRTINFLDNGSWEINNDNSR